MDRVTPRTNVALDQTIQDWIIQKLDDPIFSHPYQKSLIDILQILWQGQKNGSGGKQKPSYLPLPSLCGQALGRCSTATISVNAAWVLLYMASYILDKIEDHEAGHPIFSHFSEGAVANLASGLFLHAERFLTEIEPEQPSDAGAFSDIRIIFNKTALEVCAGQHLDLTVKEPSFLQYWEILDAKSGKFFALGAYLGARLATTEPTTLEKLTKVGRHLGIIVQITNDLNGLVPGKGTVSDLAAGRRTLPVQYALHVLPAKERARFSECLREAPGSQLAEEEARNIILSAGVSVYLSLEAEKHKQQAMNALTALKLEQEFTSPLFDLLNNASHPKMLTGSASRPAQSE